ncbi:TFIIB-type zinc ribbon-containing protein [Noviherbaspirillum aridicola]|uniref:Transcription factor zinc-finger domain-containing protein n=1 Tax=Noviherbaspirillum aridicola TaxID=2849687 RepID=A0ABQ4Q3K8_9BURK|nr:zf-TFIIB domain-containing protein [Noviherbaspirillum aridicola]GIZ51781.1 hypothetical protein NCCP691_17950 [Noviherbaspirillum aridicola]
MQCPVCSNTQLVMSERQGIEIDYCPQCRGVWLDRGELDKIIDRSAQVPQQQAAQPAQAAPPPGFGRQQPGPQPGYQPGHQSGYPPGQHSHYGNDYHKRKKKGFLGELFDFD